MAKISKTAGSANIPLGSWQNTRQSIVYIPAALTANKPGLLFLESTDGTTAGGLFLWADQSNSLRYHTSVPADEDADGTVLSMATESQANRALSNLQTTSINTSLISDTDSTDDLGSSGAYWANAYTDVLYLTSTAYLTGSANTATLTGDLVLGAGNITVTSDDGSVNGLVVTRDDDSTTAPLVQFNCDNTSDDDSVLELLQDGAGAVMCLEIMHDGTGAAIDIQAGAARTGNVIDIAMANQEAEIALLIDGAATGTSGEGLVSVNVSGVMDGDCFRADTSGANAATSALFKGIAAGNQGAATNGITAHFTDTGSAAATSYCVYIASTSNEALYVDTGLVVFDETLTMTGGADVVIAEGKLTVDSTVNETSYFIRNCATTTNPLVEIEATNTSDDTAALLIDSKSTVANVDVVVVETDGASYGITVNPAHATGAGYEFTAAADSTVPGILLDGLGTPGPWLGAAGVGMLQIQSDGTLANASASLLALIGTGGAAAASATGSMLRIVENASAGSGYAVYIASTGNLEALHVDDGKVVFDETLTVTGASTLTGAVTAAAGIQSTPVSLTAETVPDAGNSTIAAGVNNISVTCAAADDVLVLPTAVLGDVIMLKATSTTDFELQAPDATVSINGTACTGTPPKEIVVTAEDVTFAICTKAGSSGTWVTFSVTDAGVVTNGVTPD